MSSLLPKYVGQVMARITSTAVKPPKRTEHISCCTCGILHPSDWFDDEELRKPALDRRCRTVHICPHLTMNLTQYRQAREEQRDHASNTRLILPENCYVDDKALEEDRRSLRHHYCFEGYTYGQKGKRLESTSMSMTWDFSLMTEHNRSLVRDDRPVFSISWWLAFSAHRASELANAASGTAVIALAEFPQTRKLLATDFCAHLTVAECLSIVVARQGRLQDHVSLVSREKARVCQSCMAVATAWWHEGSIFLKSDRMFGRGESPTDSKWLEQCRRAGPGGTSFPF